MPRARLGASGDRTPSPLDSILSKATPCMDCGGLEAFDVPVHLYFDFDPLILPAHLRIKMTTRDAGVCFDCGLFQEFFRFTHEEMREFCSFNKDESVSESANWRYPVAPETAHDFDSRYSYRRIERWQEFFRIRNVSITKCLFLRPMFGTTLAWVAEHFDCEPFALEISQACRRTTIDRVPGVKFLQGQIHGLLEGGFTEGHRFGGIFVNHTLVHTIDIHAAIETLKALLEPDGFIMFSDEVQIKPQNPFHMVFPSETQLRRILSKHFSRIDRIDDCVVDPPPFITRFTQKGDGPDLVAWI